MKPSGPGLLFVGRFLCCFCCKISDYNFDFRACDGSVTATRQSGWLLSKSLQAINAEEGVEKREPFYTVGGNAN